MRSFIAATFITLLASTTPAHSEPIVAEDSYSDQEIADAENYQYEFEQWNLWICNAYTTGYGYNRAFQGRSYFFRAGSGEGQEARQYARLSAIRECEFRTRRRCISRDQRDCYVIRY